MLTLNRFTHCSVVLIADFEQVNADWFNLNYLDIRTLEKFNTFRQTYIFECNQQTFTCSKSIIETLEKDVKYIQS